ncbi:MAG TPA: peptidoglycan DD-metalloendopeptidase family protein, partial [Sphingobacteriaceae bacterium]
KEKQTLGSEKNSKAKVLSKLTKQEKSLKQQLDKKQREAATLAKAIQTAIRKEIEAARKKEAARLAAIKAREAAAAKAAAAKKTGTAKAPVSKSTTTSSGNILSSGTENLKLSAGFLANRGKLPSPVNNGVIIQHFGAQKYGKVTVYNDGINIKAPAGSSVHAVFSGDVIKVIYILNSYTVMIRHGEYFTVYSKMKNPTVSAGQKVTVKQVLGTVATDPVEKTTELQFQIWKNGAPVNPSSWIAR